MYKDVHLLGIKMYIYYLDRCTSLIKVFNTFIKTISVYFYNTKPTLEL